MRKHGLCSRDSRLSAAVAWDHYGVTHLELQLMGEHEALTPLVRMLPNVQGCACSIVPFGDVPV